MNRKYEIIDMETGEVVKQNISFDKSNIKLKKIMVDNMLKSARIIEDLDSNMLYEWCRITNEVNEYGQIKILGNHMELLRDKKLIDDITIAGYTLRVIDKAHPFSAMLQKNRQTFIESWKELWEVISCKDKKTQSKIKKFLTDNHIIREFNAGKGRRFVLNPFLARGSSYSSQIAISVFDDFIKEAINMNTYAIRLLQSWGVID